jgi:membrane associated rhomboid family serine protease
MIPFKDENPTRTFPFFTITIIVLNVLVFFVEIFHSSDMKALVYKYGAIPRNLLSMNDNRQVPAVLTIFTSMFMHGGFLHISGNMLYLWIFGNNIEDRLGHFRFLLFYMLSGIVAAYANSIASPASQIPMIGASGAVSGILGAYLLLYPQARVHTLIFFGFFIQIVRVPALLVIGLWGFIQLISGIISKGQAAQGGVAWFAHIGGFLFGLLTIYLWVPEKRQGD